MAGFTGVEWDTRSNEQLARDLTHGPGPAPIAEAGLAWARLAADLADAGLEFAAILARLEPNWRSRHAIPALAKLAGLAPWFADASAAAAGNGLRAEAQAAAIAVARVTMPAVAEVAAAEGVRDLAFAAGAVAPILVGAAAQAERVLHAQRMRAARVMQTYETATEPVRAPWASSQRAPDLVSETPLQTERAARRAAEAAATNPSPLGGPTVGPGIGGAGRLSTGYAMEPAKRRYEPTVVAAGQPASEALDTTRPAATGTAPLGTVPPPAPAPGMAHGAGDRIVVRTGDAASGDPGGSAAAATDDDSPLTWAELATSDRPAVRPGEVDPRYASETLLLGERGGR